MSDRIVLGTSKLGVDGRDIAFELLDEYIALLRVAQPSPKYVLFGTPQFFSCG